MATFDLNLNIAAHMTYLCFYFTIYLYLSQFFSCIDGNKNTLFQGALNEMKDR